VMSGARRNYASFNLTSKKPRVKRSILAEIHILVLTVNASNLSTQSLALVEAAVLA